MKLNKLKQILVIVLFSLGTGVHTSNAQAQSQCSGLSNSACSANDSCTWRKSSVDKNGKKTKSHCRALPGKAKKVGAKAKSASKKSSAKAVSGKKSEAKSKAKTKASKGKTKASKAKSKKATSSKGKTSKAKKKTKKS